MSIRSPFLRWRGLSLRSVAWSLPLLSSLSGCAGTPWGDTLSGSFPAPPVQATGGEVGTQASRSQDAQAPSGSPSPGAAAQSGEAVRVAPAGAGAKSKQPEAPKTTDAPSTERPKTAAPKPKTPSPATAVSPYRVTIRLPQADPSAPAEGVTEALRLAGIPFEVETIERVNGATPQSPEATPPAAAPLVRPAPPPR